MPPRRRVTSGSRESQDGLPIKEEEEGVSDWTERMAEAVPASAVPIYHEATTPQHRNLISSAHANMRHLSIFRTLCDSMDEFVRDGRIPEQLARKVVRNFDALVVPNFARCGVVVSFSAKCSYYNFAGGGGHSAHDATGDIWRICLTDFVLKTANGREVIASTGPGIENKVMVFAHPSWDAPAGGKVRRRLN